MHDDAILHDPHTRLLHPNIFSEDFLEERFFLVRREPGFVFVIIVVVVVGAEGGGTPFGELRLEGWCSCRVLGCGEGGEGVEFGR